MGMRFESDHQDDEDLTQHENYAALEDRKAGRKTMYFIVAAGLGLVILVLAFVMLSNQADSQEMATKLSLMEKRLDDMEFRLGNLVQSATAGSDLSSLQKADENLSRRFDALEKKLEGRLNQMNAALVKVQKQRAAAPPPPVKVAKPAPTPPKTRLHTVQKGETLYKISRKYGMSVDELRKLNGIGQDFKIIAGQKLKVAAKP